MAGTGKAFKYVAIALVTIVVSMVLIMSIPAVQGRVWETILERVSRHTGWTIRAESLYLAPWGTLYAENLYVGQKGRQLALCRGLRLSLSITSDFPFIKPAELYLSEPLLVSEVDETGRLVWPGLPSGQKDREDKSKAFYFLMIPRVRITEGKLSVLKGASVGYHIRDLAGRIVPRFDGDRISLDLRLEGLSDAPVLGNVRLRGTATANDDFIDLKDLAVEIPGLLESRINGIWRLDSKAGHVSFHLLYFNPSQHPYTKGYGKYFGIVTLNAAADFDPRGAKGFIKGRLSSGSEVNALFTLKKDSENGYFGYSFRGRYVVDDFLRSSGIFSFKGYFNTVEDYYAVADFRSGPIYPLVSPVKSFSRVNGIALRTEFFPGGVTISRALVKAEHGNVKLQGMLAYDTGREAAGNIEFFLKWVSEIRIPGMEDFNTEGRLAGKCPKKCGGDPERWLLEADARLYRGSEKIRIEGTFRKGEIDAKVEAKSVNLEDILPGLMAGGEQVRGILWGMASLKGSIDNPELDLECTLREVGYGGYGAGEVKVSGGGSLTREGSKSVKLKASGLTVPAIPDPLEVKALINQRDDRVTFEVEGSIGEDRSLLVKGNVFNIWSTPEVIIEKGDLKWNGSYQVSGVLGIRPGALQVSKLDIQHGPGSASLKGRIGFDKRFSLDCLLHRFPLDHIASKSGLVTEGLILNGEVKGSFEEADVNLKANLNLGKGSLKLIRKSGVVSERYSWDGLKLQFDLSNNAASAFMVLSAPYWKEDLRVSAFLPLKVQRLAGTIKRNREEMSLILPFLNTEISPDPERSVKCDLSVGDFDLAVLNILYPGKVVVEGRFSANVSVGGKFRDLHATGAGEMSIDQAYLVSEKNIAIKEVKGAFSIVDDLLRIDSITGKVMDGTFELKGTVPVKPELDGATVIVNINEVHIPEIYGISGIVSGLAEGTVRDGGFHISGKLMASRALMDLDALQEELARSVRTVEIVDREEDSAVIDEESSGGIYDRFSMNLSLDFSGGNAWVKGLGVDAEVQGGLSLKKRRGESIRIYGLIESRRGWYAFQSVRLKITEGEVRFKGMVPPDPDISFTGEKNVDDTTIRVSVVGTISQPVLKLSSSPAMNDVDILSYLLFNRPARNLTAKESMNLQEKAALFIGSKAAQKLKEVLGSTPFAPDVLEIYTGEAGHGVVEVGKYLTPDLYVTYEKDIRDEGNDQVKIEYRVNRHLSIQSQVGDERGAGVDVLWRYDFGE